MGKGNLKAKTKSKRKAGSGGKTRDLGFWLEHIGNILAWAVVLTYFIVLPLYFQNGYELIATRKYQCLMEISKYAAIVCGVYVLAHMSLWGMNKEEREAYKPLKGVDLGALSFILFAFLSHLLSDYKVEGAKNDFFFYEGSLYGASGWYMGFMTLLVVVCLYFFVSRYFRYSNYIWIPVFFVALAEFVWGNLNRYGIYPIEMEYATPSFIASFGNINWFAGFVSVMVPVLSGFFWGTKKPWVKLALIVPLLISDATILLNGSDSLVVGYFLMLFVLLLVSLKSERGLSAFSEILMLFALGAFIIGVLDKFFPDLRSAGTVLGDILLLPAIAELLFLAGLVIKIYTMAVKKGKVKYPEWVGKKLPRILGIFAASCVGLLVVLIAVNTVTGGKLPVVGKSAWFNFGPLWASKRGATWTSGWLTFKDLPIGKKLIGVGPDMFYYGLCDNETAFEYAKEAFGDARLTNAHNELLNHLVNVGILGASAFVFMCVNALKLFFKEAKENPFVIGFALSLVAYLGNNIFSFEQITSVPFMYLVLAMGGACVVKLNKERKL